MFRVSERLACRVVGQHCSTQRHAIKVVDIEEAKLRRGLREIAAEHIRWGRRMAYRLLRREGWLENHKRVHRLWSEEGLQRPTARKQKRARRADGHPVRRRRRSASDGVARPTTWWQCWRNSPASIQLRHSSGTTTAPNSLPTPYGSDARGAVGPPPHRTRRTVSERLCRVV
ncbi:transposase [Synechococcus sp. HK01-R]|nr:transposase [Synechococcus sp. HK01-R]